MKRMLKTLRVFAGKKDGMELVQVAILVAIAIVIGLVFRTQIMGFVNDVFSGLSSRRFS
ncbi:MAG: hypothetical protein LBH63_01600 [Clostridiales Family XIII bacterium]|jgi:hypothetical protein|nr:hypothetical protein [Clostridiales Family XIII bacterium]